MEGQSLVKRKQSDKVLALSKFAKNCKNDFTEFELCYLSNKFGKVYTWGSGEMGQLGHQQSFIAGLPKDREGFPFQSFPYKVKQLEDLKIVEISAGEGK